MSITAEKTTIESITADGWDIKFAPNGESKKTHILYPEFTPTSDQAGPNKSTIVITTSGEQSVTAKALLTADIRDQ